MNFTLPPSKIFSPSTIALNPLPGNALKSATCSAVKFSYFAANSVMAFANGCSLIFSSEYAFEMSSRSEIPLDGIMSVTLGSPLVIVPVLSRAAI